MKITKYSISKCIIIGLFLCISTLNFTGIYPLNTTMLSFSLAILVILFCLISFESRQSDAKDLMPIVVLCGIASLGRIVFGFIPQIQPTTVIVIIAGIALGANTGFMVGAISALVSNMLMGQGPWTIWQMLAWGIIGLISSIIGKSRLRNSLLFICIFSFISAFIYGLFVDFSTISMASSSEFSIKILTGIYIASIPFNLIHGIGNIVFAIILYKPFCRKIERIKLKFG